MSLPWREEAEYAAARARIFGYSANGGPLDQAIDQRKCAEKNSDSEKR